MAAPDVPVLQRQLATALDLGTTIVGPLSETLVVVFDQVDAEWRLLQITGSSVSVVDTVVASGIDLDVAVVNDGVIASGPTVFVPKLSGGTLTIVELTWVDSGDIIRVYCSDPDYRRYTVATTTGQVVYDQGEGVTDDPPIIDGLVGTDQTMIGAPNVGRWLRLSGDDSGDPCTVEFIDVDGMAYDSITFDHPDDSWMHDRPTNASLGPSDVTWSTLWWVRPAPNLTTYVGTRLGDDASIIVTRTLSSDGGVLAWLDDEAVIAEVPHGTFGHDVDAVRPYAVAWDGQLAIGFREESFG